MKHSASASEADGEEASAEGGDDEEMQDLFGEGEEAETVKHEECVCFKPLTRFSRLRVATSAATPASSEHVDQNEGLSSPERRHREAMEYAEEDDETEAPVIQIVEAKAAIPNIPVPRSSDGNVSFLDKNIHCLIVILTPVSTGSFVCPILSRSTRSPSTQTRILGPSRRTTRCRRPRQSAKRACRLSSR